MFNHSSSKPANDNSRLYRMRCLRYSRQIFLCCSLALYSSLALYIGPGLAPAYAVEHDPADNKQAANTGTDVVTNASTTAPAGTTTTPPPASGPDYGAPITITADSAEQNDIKGTTVYKGNVQIEQGQLTISAETVTIHSSMANDETGERSVSLITAQGSPAIFVQAVPNQERTIRATGNTIRYWLDRGVINLEDNANIDQQGSSVSGDAIEYFIDQQLVKAKADPNKTSGRVQTIISPPSSSETPAENKNADKSDSDNGSS